MSLLEAMAAEIHIERCGPCQAKILQLKRGMRVFMQYWQAVQLSTEGTDSSGSLGAGGRRDFGDEGISQIFDKNSTLEREATAQVKLGADPN